MILNKTLPLTTKVIPERRVLVVVRGEPSNQFDDPFFEIGRAGFPATT
jgi:hypothetical protein